MLKVEIMCGLPGCGKTTYAKGRRTARGSLPTVIGDIECERCKIYLGVVECDEAPAAYCPTCWKITMRECAQLAQEAKVIKPKKGRTK